MLSYSKGRAFVVFLKWMVCFIVLSQVVAGIFAAVEAGLLISAGERVTIAALVQSASSPWAIVIGNTLAWVAFMFWELKTRHINWGDALVLNARPLLRFLPVALLGLGAMILLNDLDYYFDLLLPIPDAFKDAMAEIGNFDANPVGATLALVVVAPVTEEYLCRGILLRGLLNRVAPWTAIVLSAVFFAVMHLNPWQAAGAFGRQKGVKPLFIDFGIAPTIVAWLSCTHVPEITHPIRRSSLSHHQQGQLSKRCVREQGGVRGVRDGVV